MAEILPFGTKTLASVGVKAAHWHVVVAQQDHFHVIPCEDEAVARETFAKYTAQRQTLAAFCYAPDCVPVTYTFCVA